MTTRVHLQFLCPVRWEEMDGEGPTRRCHRCDRDVLDLSSAGGRAMVARALRAGATPCVRALVAPVASLPDASKVAAVAVALNACSGEREVRVLPVDPAPPVRVAAVDPPPNITVLGSLAPAEWPDPALAALEQEAARCPPGWTVVLPDGACATVVRPREAEGKPW